jgi:hypothetical protein
MPHEWLTLLLLHAWEHCTFISSLRLVLLVTLGHWQPVQATRNQQRIIRTVQHPLCTGLAYCLEG